MLQKIRFLFSSLGLFLFLIGSIAFCTYAQSASVSKARALKLPKPSGNTQISTSSQLALPIVLDTNIAEDKEIREIIAPYRAKLRQVFARARLHILLSHWNCLELRIVVWDHYWRNFCLRRRIYLLQNISILR